VLSQSLRVSTGLLKVSPQLVAIGSAPQKFRRPVGDWLSFTLVRMNLAPTQPVVQDARCEKSNSRCSRLDESTLRQSSTVSSATHRRQVGVAN
jgi:hypothetical protein